MFVQRGQFRVAHAHYQNVDLESRIEGASPHQLVAVMFEELLKALDAMVVAIERREHSQRIKRQSRAMTILHGLESSLDFAKGGEIAEGLAAIYREARRLTMLGSRESDAEQVRRAREMLAEIAGAWSQIGTPAARG
ncbi:flagellar export chaperone FliS [Sphingosinicella terrae]|jgi:flagellar secretion chaperone FliS|uniref:flagellar export chaperone FliS n=1 Tax=Sphingosinicella terrae TaxID=2172047 RepID=UPI000E0CCEF7|nr:flagellar export chaperone FliS [Sphingosinicella terrae]